MAAIDLRKKKTSGLTMVGGNVTTTTQPTPQPTPQAQPEVIKLENKKTEWASVGEQMKKPVAKVALATTAVLATTLAVLTGIGLASGAFATGTATGATTTAGLARNAVVAATGKVPIKSLMNPTGVLRVVETNTKIAALQSSYVSKLVAGATNPAVLAGVLISAISFQSMMVPNEKGDAVTSLGIGINAAVKAGDIEGATKMKELMDNLANPSILEKIEAMVPIWGYMAAVADKIKANKMVGDITMARLQNQTNTGTTGNTGTTDGTTTAAQDWNAIFAAQLDRQEAEREADAKAQNESIARWAEAKAAERDADAKYWAAKITEANARAKAKAEVNEKYWLEVYKQRENSAPSALNFGLL